MSGHLPDDGFVDWFNVTQPGALKLARRMSGTDAAPDLVAEGFARALARWAKVGALPYRDAWLLRTVANLAIDAARRKAPRPAHTVEVDVNDTAALRVALAEALRHLSRRQREVIVLRYLVDLSEDEIATALTMSAGTVKTHTKRGLAAMRSRLDTPFEELLPHAD